MKHILLLTIALLVYVPTQAQFTIVGGDSTAIKSVYAGLLYTGQYPFGGLELQQQVAARVAAVTAVPFGAGTINAKIAHTFPGTIAHIYIEQKLANLTLKLGSFPRPVSTFRPYPFCADGQFSKQAFAIMPGATTGGLASMTAPWGISTDLGVYLVSQKPELNFGLGLTDSSSFLKFAWYMNQYRRGVAFTGSLPIGSLTSYFDSDSLASLYIELQTRFGRPYTSLTYNYNTKKVLNAEVGWTKEYPAVLSTMYGIGYEYPGRAVKLYVLVHI